MSSSSIFSSEAMRWRSWPWRRVAAFALALLLAASVCETGLRMARGHVRHFALTDYPFLLGEIWFRFEQLQREGRRIDILLTGDSTAELGLAPGAFRRALGADLEVFSLSGPMPPRVLELFTKRLDREFDCKPPRVVICWAFSSFNDNNPNAPDFWAEYFSYAGVKEMEARMSPLDHLALWRYRNVARKALKVGPPFLRAAPWTIGQSGWFAQDQRFDSVPDESRRRNIETAGRNIIDYEIGPETIKRVHAAFRAVSERSADVTVVLAPLHPDFERFHPDSVKAGRLVRDTILPIARQYGIRAMDCRHPDFLTREDFYDVLHLNRSGALRFSKWLAETLAADEPAEPSGAKRR